MPVETTGKEAASENYWMSQLDLDVSPGLLVWPRVLVVLGLSICFAPANVAAYLYTPLELRGAALGLLSLPRNEGGSVGTSLAQTFHERREQFHGLRLGEYPDPFNAAAHSFIAHAQAFFSQGVADPFAAQQLGLQQFENLRRQQASALAHLDCFWMLAALTFVLVFVALSMSDRLPGKALIAVANEPARGSQTSGRNPVHSNAASISEK